MSQLGLTHSMVISALYAQIALRGGLPFDVRIPDKRIPDFYTIRNAVQSAAQQAGVKRVWLFGSCARGETKQGSDVDLLVEQGGAPALALGGMQFDLEKRLGMPVDIVTTNAASESFRAAIREDEILIYEC